MTTNDAAKPHHSPKSPQVTQSTLALTDKLQHFDDEEGPRPGAEAGGRRRAPGRPVRANSATWCLFGVLSTLRCHEIYTKAFATTPVLACFLPGASFARLIKRVKKHRVSTQSDDADGGSPRHQHQGGPVGACVFFFVACEPAGDGSSSSNTAAGPDVGSAATSPFSAVTVSSTCFTSRGSSVASPCPWPPSPL
jgi:hypothetical protein